MNVKTSRKILLTAGLATALVVSPKALLAGVAAASPPPPSPDVPSCPAGYYYSETGRSSNTAGTGTYGYAENYNAKSLSVSVSISSSTTMSYTGTLGGSAEIDLIIATIGTSDSVSVTKSSSGSVSTTATVSGVPIGKYGIVQLGDSVWHTSGTYYYESATCIESDESAVSGILPFTAGGSLGLIGGINTVASPPWAQVS
jgi:hypothetical protein